MGHSRTRAASMWTQVATMGFLSLAQVSGRPGPQNDHQGLILAPLHLARHTGSAVISTGDRLVHGVPSVLDTASDTAVSGVRLVPHTVNTVNDFTVDTINSVPDTVDTTVELAAAVPAHTVRAVANAPGTFVHFGNSTVTHLANTAVTSGTGFIRAAPHTIINAPHTLGGAGLQWRGESHWYIQEYMESLGEDVFYWPLQL